MVKRIRRKSTGSITVESPVASAQAHPETGQASALSPEQRHFMIAEAAYFLAEHRGFAPNNERAAWFEAEAEIDRMVQSA